MVRLLPLPKGISRAEYSRALRNLPKTKIFAARRILSKHGTEAVSPLSVFGLKALSLIEDHGDPGLKAIQTHGTVAFELRKLAGFPAVKVLSVLDPEEFATLRNSFAHGIDRLEYVAMANIIEHKGTDGFKALLRNSDKLHKAIDANILGRTH
ncbi:MAG: hypothetical protein QXR53_01365 [Candidatus Norongarragalinales archaeon]